MNFSCPPVCSKSQAGFTLIEMIVSVALFAIVMVVAVGALLSLTGANKKAQAIQSVMNNLNITVDGMVRNIRMGTKFHCGVGDYSGSNSDNCAGGNSGFTFSCNPDTATCAFDGSRWSYQFSCPVSFNSDGTCPSGGYITKSEDGAAAARLTAPEVSIQKLSFYVVGAIPGKAPGGGIDLIQPTVIMVVTGTAGGQNVRTQTFFHIQATAVQRELDL